MTDRILAEQRDCRDYIAAHPNEDHSRGAGMGIADWVMCEVLELYGEKADEMENSDLFPNVRKRMM